MENKQTALQGFIEALTSNGYVIINQTLIDTYLAMEKEQITNAWDRAYAVGGANGSNDWVNECELTDNGEYYYKETYGK